MLTQDDLQTLRLIMRDEITTAVSASEERMQTMMHTEIAASEQRMQTIMHEEIAASEQRTGERLERLEGRMEGLEGRMEGLEGRMEGLEGRVARLDGRMDQLDKTQQALHSEMILFKAGLHSEFSQFKREIHEEIRTFKADVRKDLSMSKHELSEELATFRASIQSEVRGDLATFKLGIQTSLMVFKNDLKDERDKVISMLEDVVTVARETRMDQRSLESKLDNTHLALKRNIQELDDKVQDLKEIIQGLAVDFIELDRRTNERLSDHRNASLDDTHPRLQQPDAA